MSALQFANETHRATRSDLMFYGLEPAPVPAPPQRMTLAESVAWLDIAVDWIDRGPAALTIEAVERYRRHVMEILEHVRPVVEREAGLAH